MGRDFRYSVRNIAYIQMKLYEEASSRKERPLKHLKKLLTKEEVLRAAWDNLNRDTTSTGMDNVSIRQIEGSGVDEFLETVKEELKTNRYRADIIRRVDIPKENGNQRHLGIITVKDRLVQNAIKLVIEPIFEADFENCSFGFRPFRSTKLASLEVYKWLESGLNQVVKGDIKDCFDSIPHNKLMDCLETRIGDKYVLSIIESSIKAGVAERDSVSYPVKGVPQGGVISPLLANVYLDQMDKIWRRDVFDGRAGRPEERLVRYGDDFVVLGKNWVDLAHIESILADLELEINKEKTYISNVKKGFEFLGYTFRQVSSEDGLEGKIRLTPSGNSIKRVIEAIEKATEFDLSSPRPIECVIEEIQRVVRPWIYYYHHTEYMEGLEEIQRYFKVQIGEYVRKYREPEPSPLQENVQVFKAF